MVSRKTVDVLKNENSVVRQEEAAFLFYVSALASMQISCLKHNVFYEETAFNFVMRISNKIKR
jgi:hypothetical protein